MTEELRDITIVGGGPTGLFGAFYAGMRGVSCRIIDSLPELGGQLTALYPEKYIFDVGGFTKILAKDLASALIEQGLQFGAEVVLDSRLEALELGEDGTLTVRTEDRAFPGRAVIVAGGKGAFIPTRLKCPGYDEFEGRGIAFGVRDKEVYRDRKVVVVGGGDTAMDFVLMLKDVAASLTLVHRRDGWRGFSASVREMEEAEARGEIEVRTFHELRSIEGNGSLERITIFDNRKGREGPDIVLEADAMLSCLGFKPDLGPIKEWGLEVKKNRIVVDQLMRTNRAGVFAAGDLVGYPGKVDLIVAGFSEVAIAVNGAVRHLDPKAPSKAGHSTHLKVFKDK